MKNKTLQIYVFKIFVFILLFIAVDFASVYAVTLRYEYTPTGNRKKCYVGFAKIAATPDKQEEYTEIIDDIKFKIFPNPTKGLMKINIETENKIENIKIELFDISSKLILNKLATNKEIELDITEAPTGSYFMKIFINNKPYYWNVLKE